MIIITYRQKIISLCIHFCQNHSDTVLHLLHYKIHIIDIKYQENRSYHIELGLLILKFLISASFITMF